MLSAPWLAGRFQVSKRFLKEMVQAHNRSIGVLENECSRIRDLVPAKIILGKQDVWIPAATAERLKRHFNAAERVIIEEAGQLVQYDQPGRLALEVGLRLSKN